MATADRFSGYYEHTLDAKGRISIPAKFKEQLGPSITFIPGNGEYIKICSLKEWDYILEKYAEVDEDQSPELYDKMRRMMMTAMDGNKPDAQGRLLIPPMMREHALLDKEVIVSGAGRHVEIWEPGRFYDFIGKPRP